MLGRKRARVREKIREVQRAEFRRRDRQLRALEEFKRNGAASKIQIWIRARLARMHTRFKVYVRKVNSALKIQASWRAHVSRRVYWAIIAAKEEWLRKRNRACSKIQRLARVFLAKNKLDRLRQVKRDAENKRRLKKRKAFNKKVLQLAALEIDLRKGKRKFIALSNTLNPFRSRQMRKAALNLQRVYRGHMARKRFRKKMEIHIFRVKMAHREKRRTSAIRIQSLWKGYCVRKAQDSFKSHQAATLIQKTFRCHRQRMAFSVLLIKYKACITIQRMWRGKRQRLSYRRYLAEFRKLSKAVLPLQMVVRSWLARKRVSGLLAIARRREEEFAKIKSDINSCLQFVRDSIVMTSALTPYSMMTEGCVQLLFKDMQTWGSKKRQVVKTKSGKKVKAKDKNIYLDNSRFMRLLRESPGLIQSHGPLTSQKVDLCFTKEARKGKHLK
eukprot:TRINITY_DN3475_c0_g1_i11.p1 TRINITY_DN3475_c0_g1~~TRINITY_DN3475_c0_g1_i11.p1  ORF type:complete len:443 (-),score=96.62 TRINITY_DN3475_c0_g1_i11:69-1397(-)